MAKFNDLINEIFYEEYPEEVNEAENKENSMMLYYDVDIFITRSQEKLQAAEGQGGEEEQEKEQEQEQGQGQIYRHKAQGELNVPKEKVENIQNLENLLNYASNVYEGGDPVINELVVETIKTAAGVGQGAIGEIFDEDDKMIVDIDYGFSREDSVGVKINKAAGSEVVSFSMKHNGNILPSKFDYNTFNNQLLSLRKRFMEG
jgi:hypothetical protein